MEETLEKFSEGCLWEDVGPWTLIANCEVQRSKQPCRHCHSPRSKERKRPYDGSTYLEKFWICPYVVVAENEGGHNSTGVCLSCIIEALGASVRGIE